MTVPFGGDVANPMVQQESGPSKFGYVIGTILIIIGVVGGIGFGVSKIVSVQDAIDDFDRVPVGETRTLDLDAGDYVVYGESGGGSAIEAVLANFRIRPEGSEDELTVEDYVAEFTYDVGNRPLRAEFTFEIDESGPYQVQADGIRSGATTAAIGPSIVGDFVAGIVGGLIIGGVGVLVGVIFLIVTGVRRRKFRQRGWLNGWNQPGAPQPGTWSPPAAPGGYGTPPPAAGGWNPPPPPGGGSYPPPPGGTF
jgi:hypothetical protein